MNSDYNNFQNNNNGGTDDKISPEAAENAMNNAQSPESAKEDISRVGSASEQSAASFDDVNKNEEKSEGASGEYHYSGSQMGDRGREQFSPYGDQASRQRDPYSDRESGSYTYRSPYGAPQSGKGFYGQADKSDKERDPYAPKEQNGFGENQSYGGWGNYPPYEDFSPYKEHKKPRGKGVGAGVLAIVCTLCVILSAAAGFGGATLYIKSVQSENVGDGSSGNSNNKGGTTVIDRVVESDGTTSTGEKGIYTDVATAVKDSVVEITTEFQVTGFFQYVSEGAGSGVIISEDGYVITNNHVISDTSTGGVADSITVRLTNGNEYKAKVIGKDADSDIAVIKITPDEKLTYAVFGDSDKLTVGEEVLAVGNPLGELGGTVTNGIISALDREISVDGTTMNLLQTNAAINPGNSGGGLFNMKGELIGVVNAKSSGSGIEGLGFAIPSNDAYDVATQLMENGYVTGKVYLGVSFSDIDDPYTAYRYFKSQATGVYVVDLVEGYNDDALKVGDRIVAVDGNEITSFSQIKDMLKEKNVGDMLEFAVYRSGKLTQVDVKCYEYVPEQSDSVDFGEE